MKHFCQPFHVRENSGAIAQRLILDLVGKTFQEQRQFIGTDFDDESSVL
jgi:hypothetical protein